jgi:protein gp37
VSDNSLIEWTDASWNPVTGCTKVSPGCDHCYAERDFNRFNGAGSFDTVRLMPNRLITPIKWRRPRRIFVNSMSDLFHVDVPATYIVQVFDIMARANWHQYQVLTKRSERLRDLDHQLKWEQQIWMGVSIENEDYISRADDLRKTSAHIKFLSLEPLLGSLRKLKLKGIDWVIVGGESGPGARPIDQEWVRELRDRCQCEGVAFFFKQWGGVQKSRTGRVLDGSTWNEMPILITAAAV